MYGIFLWYCNNLVNNGHKHLIYAGSDTLFWLPCICTRVADPHHIDADPYPAYHTLKRIRIRTFTLMWIRIRPFNLMQIRILPLTFRQIWTPPCSLMALKGFQFFTLMRIRIQLSILMRIRIRIQLPIDSQIWTLQCSTIIP